MSIYDFYHSDMMIAFHTCFGFRICGDGSNSCCKDSPSILTLISDHVFTMSVSHRSNWLQEIKTLFEAVFLIADAKHTHKHTHIGVLLLLGACRTSGQHEGQTECLPEEGE